MVFSVLVFFYGKPVIIIVSFAYYFGLFWCSNLELDGVWSKLNQFFSGWKPWISLQEFAFFPRTNRVIFASEGGMGNYWKSPEQYMAFEVKHLFSRLHKRS